MVFKRLSQWLLTTAVVALTLLTAACSSAPSAEDVLATVPDNSVVVFRINLKSALDNADIQLKDGKYVLSEDLESLMSEAPSGAQSQVEDFLKVLPAADIENIFVFVTEREEWAVTVGLSHAGAVEEGLKAELGAPEKDGDYKIFDIDRRTHVMLRDNQLWLTDEVNKVKRAIERAEEESFTAYAGPSQYLLGDHSLAVAVNMKSVRKIADRGWPEALDKYSKDFITFDSKLDGPAITACLSTMDAEGKCTFPGKLFTKLDTSFLRYVPDNAMVVVALGKPERELLSEMSSVIRNAYTDTILSHVDGTSAFALIPPADGNLYSYGNDNNWDYVALSHMQKDEIEEISNLFAFNMGVDINPACQYNYTSPWGSLVGFGGNAMYWGNYDNYLAASSQPLTASHTNSFAATFEGKRAAACVVLPKNSPIPTELKLPFGASLTATYETDGVKAVFKLVGSNDAILKSIFHVVADKKWRREVVDGFFGENENRAEDVYVYEDIEEVEPDYYGDEVVEVEAETPAYAY